MGNNSAVSDERCLGDRGIRPFFKRRRSSIITILLVAVVLASVNFVEVIKWNRDSHEQRENTGVEGAKGSGYPKEVKQTSYLHQVAGLSCPSSNALDERDYGNAQEEVVYWRDIDGDSSRKSPYRCQDNASMKPSERKYLTFEPDEAGWNNMRMAMETAITMAIAMGRILVLPPQSRMYLLWEQTDASTKNKFGFEDFFHIDSLQHELESLEVMTFKDFLEQEVLTGNILADPETGKTQRPPKNRTDWNGHLANWESSKRGGGMELWKWWREAATTLPWQYSECVAVFPSPTDDDRQCQDSSWIQTTAQDDDRMQSYLTQVLANDRQRYQMSASAAAYQRIQSYDGNPTEVDDSPQNRLAEIIAHRQKLCVYDRSLQEASVVHAPGEQAGTRFLIHFYAFVFMEDWKNDLWIKRLVRDHLRYVDEIQCAAARIVAAMHNHARDADGNPYGTFDTMHIRRGDFQQAYKQVLVSGSELYEDHSKHIIADKRTIYVATDEKDYSYFDSLKEHYQVFYLKDFIHLLKGVNPNFYGMIDQVVASTGEVFLGTYLSTFSGYINRLRGYRLFKMKPSEVVTGQLQSFYLFNDERLNPAREQMRTYHSVQEAFWMREFPVAWRDIDHDVGRRWRRLLTKRW